MVIIPDFGNKKVTAMHFADLAHRRL